MVQHPDLQDDPQRLTALSGLALSAGWSADPGRSERVGEQLLDVAQEGDPQTLLLAQWALGFSHWLRGGLSPPVNIWSALCLMQPGSQAPPQVGS